MIKTLAWLALTLRWLAVLWLVGWALYVTLWADARLSTVEGMMSALSTLLIPAAFAFGLSWGLDRFNSTDRGGRRTRLIQ